MIRVIRSPRAVAERFDRLQLEAKEQIQVFTKPPFFMRSGNPVQDKVLKRGVRARSLYEKAALEDAGIRPYLDKWVSAGEDARIYDGELPHKLVIFDSKVVLMPLIRPGQQIQDIATGTPRSAQSLSLALSTSGSGQRRLTREIPRTTPSRNSAISENGNNRRHPGGRLERRVSFRRRNHRTRRHNPALVRNINPTAPNENELDPDPVMPTFYLSRTWRGRLPIAFILCCVGVLWVCPSLLAQDQPQQNKPGSVIVSHSPATSLQLTSALLPVGPQPLSVSPRA